LMRSWNRFILWATKSWRFWYEIFNFSRTKLARSGCYCKPLTLSTLWRSCKQIVAWRFPSIVKIPNSPKRRHFLWNEQDHGRNKKKLLDEKMVMNSFLFCNPSFCATLILQIFANSRKIRM
jgi:hypothetical protein